MILLILTKRFIGNIVLIVEQERNLLPRDHYSTLARKSLVR